MSPFDTIVAPITGSQPAAVAIIRLSGPDAWDVAARVFLSWPKEVRPYRATYGRYVTGDEGLVLPFAKDSGYTGEEAVELSLHGSPASVSALVNACIQAGARVAAPGEFTQRAFLNGRMDLTQAEAVADTVNALTATQLRMANRQREGVLSAKVSEIRSDALRILAAIEASVDFEEEIGPLDRPWANGSLQRLRKEVEGLLATAQIGRILRQGLRIAIVGPPNAGKSSLFNALVGRERAIVTELPGTTRDYIEELLDFAGVPVVLIDTAGLRESTDEAESLGIQRSISQASKADLVWYVYDCSLGTLAFEHPLTGFEVWTIGNKSDLPHAEVPGPFFVSAATGQGLDRLVAEVAKFASAADALPVPPINERHKSLLQSALEDLEAAQETLKGHRPDDLLSTQLRSISSRLGQITGEDASEDMVDRIFTDFCIGK